MDQEQLAKVLKGEGTSKDLALQHALIFCLKIIDTCIDNASERLGLKIEEMPLFGIVAKILFENKKCWK